MATDATGSPTSLGIPKYNVNVDPPSGLGFNATMDSINTILISQAATLTASVNTKASLALVIALGG